MDDPWHLGLRFGANWEHIATVAQRDDRLLQVRAVRLCVSEPFESCAQAFERVAVVGTKAAKERRCRVGERPIGMERPFELPSKRSAECDLVRRAPKRGSAFGELTFEAFSDAKRLRDREECCAVEHAALCRAIESRAEVDGAAHVRIGAALAQFGDLFRERPSARRSRISQRRSHGERQLARWRKRTSNRDQREERAPLEALQ